jgi:hypothetical protein
MKLLLPLLFLWISHKQWHTAIILKTIQKYSYIKIQQSTIKYGTYNSMRNNNLMLPKHMKPVIPSYGPNGM